MRYIVFYFKLDNSIKLISVIYKVPCKSYTDVPKNNIYNIDKMASYTSNYLCRIVLSKDPNQNLGHLFQMTLEADGRLTFHIIVFLTF